MNFYNFLCYFFSFYTFFYPRHSPTPTGHTYDPHLLPTPTTSTHYPRWSFHMWRYHVFARKLTWCFISVYITIIHRCESTTSHLNNNNNNLYWDIELFHRKYCFQKGSHKIKKKYKTHTIREDVKKLKYVKTIKMSNSFKLQI